MAYEINVSKKDSKGTYRHFFATAERSITTSSKLTTVYEELSDAFPSPEYHMSVTHWNKIGEEVNINELNID